ncbi:concanavalin A-like lectin protein kinase family protein [Actinidia rufa]|uniref:non-specific serine/threonine protein kinase n=1 Tax=Actinidia rufa TaxID=165716 RepID=A0A7J0FHH4_9ERIC|nr:concanavalin A-like lectin protein kinase family protein [Actinidia rufa]
MDLPSLSLPPKSFPEALPAEYLGLFNRQNIGLSSNHILAVELDTFRNEEFNDINHNHVGIDINSLNSIASAPAGYFADKSGAFNNLSLASGKPMQVWVEYDGIHRQLNVTLTPINVPKPKQPLLSLTQDLSPFLLDYMMKKIMEVLEDWEVQFGPHRFNYKDLFIATKGFKDKEFLGRGGFGRVYHGVLPTSNIQVAVKRVSHDSRQGMREFVAEIATIGRLRHPNLVRLLGYCRRKQELLLVYDFMPNGSLEKYLYGQLKGTLNWKQRFKIIRDVASGLFYLHQQWVQVIIHRDIKASNILIDNEFNGRLGDFGLAKLCDHGIDPQTSHVAGTLGYIAPEMARTGKASTSTDLFAFGAFMLEVVCGRRPVEPRASPDEVILIDWVFECLERGNILEAIDQQLGAEYVVEEAELILKLGLLCSHTIAAARPSMSTVVQYLEGEAQLPAEDLIDIIKSRDFSEAPKEQAVLSISIPSIAISEPFISQGR